MNLAYHYPPVYWATAVMTVEAGALDIDESNGANYGKIAAAIGRTQSEGYRVELPSINKSDFGFIPDVENNSIMYGLKGISDVGDELIKNIMNNRPYASVEDFINKIEPQKKQMISLIKSGAFNEFGDRRKIMKDYLYSICPKKVRITLQNMNSLIDYNLIPEDLNSYIYLYNFNKYIKKKELPEGYKLDERAINFLCKNFPDIDISDGYLETKLWKKTYDKSMDNLKAWIKENEENLIDAIQTEDVKDIWNLYCSGNDSAWEMDTLGFYNSSHELANININTHSIKNLTDGNYKNTVDIVGTVLSKEPYKHMVTILTPEGVIDLKFTGEQFAQYNKTISEVKNDIKKVLEKSWFIKGTLLLVNGYKSGETFRVRNLSKIISVDEEGNVKTTRYRYGE